MKLPHALTATLLCSLPLWLVWAAFVSSADKLPEIRLPKPWVRVEIEGKIEATIPPINGPGMNGFKAGRKRIYLMLNDDSGHHLCFASEDDYFQAERHATLRVVVRGIVVKHGDAEWLLMEGIKPR